MTRKAPKSIVIESNVRCQRLYPVETTKKTVAQLKTIGIKLNKEEAIPLARVLLAATQDWDEIDITGHRFDRRKTDGTYRLTVTSAGRPGQQS